MAWDPLATSSSGAAAGGQQCPEVPEAHWALTHGQLDRVLRVSGWARSLNYSAKENHVSCCPLRKKRGLIQGLANACVRVWALQLNRRLQILEQSCFHCTWLCFCWLFSLNFITPKQFVTSKIPGCFTSPEK